MGKAGRELVVRASSRKEGWEKNLYGEQFAGLIDGDGCASVKSSCSRFKKKTAQSASKCRTSTDLFLSRTISNFPSL